jgi:hypothetical protein
MPRLIFKKQGLSASESPPKVAYMHCIAAWRHCEVTVLQTPKMLSMSPRKRKGFVRIMTPRLSTPSGLEKVPNTLPRAAEP